MAAISSSRHQCLTVHCDSDAARRKTWYRNLEYGTESEPEEKARKILLQLFSKVEADGAVLFDPSVLFRCGSKRKRYDARFV